MFIGFHLQLCVLIPTAAFVVWGGGGGGEKAEAGWRERVILRFGVR